LINFLNGIAQRRHHSQVRNNPWTMFFYGVTRHQKVDGRSLPQAE
jgi:predicted secreted Zn-dependent protease